MLSTRFFNNAKFLKIAAIAGCVFSIIISCKQEAKKPPLDEAKFVAVMVDVHLLEARLENIKQLNDTAFYAAGKNYEAIYEKHGVNQQQFRETFDYYMKYPKLMDKMYEKIVDELSEQEAKVKE